MPPHKSDPIKAAHARLHVNLRLERWHRRCIYFCFLLLFASGAAWLAARYFLRPVGQFGETIHPIEPWAMKVHGAGTMLTLFFLGSVMNSHVRRALRSGRNLASGWTMIGAMALLVLTAYGLYYLAGEGSRPQWSVLHWIIGLALPALVGAHVALGRASRKAPHHEPAH